jgi:hypothetical protein
MCLFLGVSLKRKRTNYEKVNLTNAISHDS